MPDDWQRALAVVAHPDDLEYGAAMAVAKWTSQGRQVSYLLATRGEAGIDAMPPDRAGPLREAEQRAAAAAVGVGSVEFLDHPDGTVEYGLDLRRDIARAVRRHRPELIVSLNHHPTWGGRSLNMADHRALGLATLDAGRDAANRWVFPELLDEGLEPWGGVRWVAFSGSPDPSHAVDTTGHLEAAVASLEAHRAYLDGLGGDFDPREFLGSSARGTGERFGTELAVAFELYPL